MKIQKQLNRHDPENGIWGDCYRTCIASILNIEPHEVPHVYDNGNKEGVHIMKDWLNKRGYSLLTVLFPKENSIGQVMGTIASLNPDVYYLLTGRSKNNCDHVVVCCNNEIINDPSIDNSGIMEPSETGYWWIEFLIPSIIIKDKTNDK